MESKPITITQLSLPNGGGAIRGIGETFQPNAFTGTASLSIPILTSPCRGVEPKLSVDYSSGAGNGVFGLGFGLAIPNIARKTEKGIPRYDGSDTFLLSNADDLVPALVRRAGRWEADEQHNGLYHFRRFRPRTEGLFARIEQRTRLSDGDVHWQVTTKDNVTSVYGRSDKARVADATRVYQWLIEETYDVKGNRILYEYRPEVNRPLDRILYGNYIDAAGKEQWHFEVIFEYGEPLPENLEQLPSVVSYHKIPLAALRRDDPFSSFRAGFEIRTEVLCRAVLMFHRFAGEFNGEPFLIHCTRFDYNETPYLSQLAQVTQIGVRKETNGYQCKAMPPLSLSYSSSPSIGAVAPEFAPLTATQSDGVRGILHQPIGEMVDLYGEGLPGILYSDDQATLYWRAQGGGHYALPSAPARFPIDRDLQSGRFALMDLDGDGNLDLVKQAPTGSGYFQSHPNGTWDPFQTFATYPLDMFEQDRQMIDTTGDGLADLVLFEVNGVKVYPSLGKLGFAPPTVQRRAADLPITSHTSATEAVRFADMFGDGGSHIVRIRNGSVECWPHLGYGRFGDRIEFANAPHFDHPFDAARLFLTDLDGSGTADLIYACYDHLEIYRNQSGNGFGEREILYLPRPYDSINQIRFADVLGNGVACLVLTSRGADLSLRHDYFDFAGGTKPHLLVESDNHMGALTRIHYASSTRFYLADQSAGTPWQTRLHFPVQVIESTETIDQIAGTHLVTRYAYHDGYFDPIEREFRGFGHVEQWDAESFAQHTARAAASTAAQHSVAYVAPAYMRIWYHTGAHVQAGQLSGHYKDQYYQGDLQAHDLPDSMPEQRTLFTIDINDLVLLHTKMPPDVLDESWRQVLAKHGLDLGQEHATITNLPDGDWQISNRNWQWAYRMHQQDDVLVVLDDSWQALPAEAMHEAYRALHGHELRREVYGDDSARDPQLAQHPYSVTESNFTVRLVQPHCQQPYAVCFPHSCETISYHYEREPADPRVEHEFTSELDDFGHVLKSCHFFYPRRGSTALPEQRQPRALVAVNRFINVLPVENESGSYLLLGIPVEEQTFELGGLARLWSPDTGSSTAQPVYLSGDQVASHLRAALTHPIRFDASLTDDYPQARLLTWQRHLYWDEAQSDALPLGEVTAKELLHHSDSAVFSVEQIAEVFAANLTEAMLSEGGYIRAGGYWWNSGLTHYYYDDKAFFLPWKQVDMFNAESTLTYDDPYHLVPIKATDALGNIISVDIDYHTLQPYRLTDANGNVTEARFDPLGMVIATSIFGTQDGKPAGDLPLTDVVFPKPEAMLILQHPQNFLLTATHYFFYDFFAWHKHKQPPHTITLQRETHVHDLAPGDESFIQVHLAYMDGFGRTLQSKSKAGPGLAQMVNTDGTITETSNKERWLTSGSTIYNNKGRPVKQYEPFYSTTPDYQADNALTQHGVTTVHHYDPLLRVLRIDAPDGSFSKIEFTPWQEEYYDANDTVKDSTFAMQDIDNGIPQADQDDARRKAEYHYNTPDIHVLDNLGRTFLVIQQLKEQSLDAQNPAQVTLVQLKTYRGIDIQGHERFSIDPRLYALEGTPPHNVEYDYDMHGVLLKTVNADAGTHWVLHNALGNSIHVWDSRNFHISTRYDQLQRPLELCVQGDDGHGLVLNHVVERVVYGERIADAQARNLRGRVVEHYDQAGVVRIDGYTIDGLPQDAARQLRKEYRTEANWADRKDERLEDELFLTRDEYDALGRIMREHQPDGSTITHTYHSEGWLRDVTATFADGTIQPVVAKIDYNAKGQRTAVRYGNDVTTTYAYDPQTFHLIHLKTARTTDAPRSCLGALLSIFSLGFLKLQKKQDPRLQDICYTYDPVGNITRIRDHAYGTVIANQQRIEALNDYTYDSLYRLRQAKGREHQAVFGGIGNGESTPEPLKASRMLNLNNLEELRNYNETYTYDTAGNRIRLQHQAAEAWTQNVQIDTISNRIQGQPYDEHGNLTSLEGGRGLHWNYRDNLASVDLILRDEQSPDREFYVYDSSGRRIRKVTETLKNGDGLVEINETIYLGSVDIQRVRQQTKNTVKTTLERLSLYVMDESRRVAVAHQWRSDTGRPNRTGTRQLRYLLDNHLGSVALELSDHAELISYEEYYPYGGTAVVAGDGQTEVALKRYRYSGKERDDSTGLYYYGARYYAPWLGRWINPDPAGPVDGLNLYSFVSGNPITLIDEEGLCGKSKFVDIPNKLRSLRNAVGQKAIGHLNEPVPENTSLGQTILNKGKEVVATKIANTHFAAKGDEALKNAGRQIDAGSKFEFIAKNAKHVPIVGKGLSAAAHGVAALMTPQHSASERHISDHRGALTPSTLLEHTAGINSRVNQLEHVKNGVAAATPFGNTIKTGYETGKGIYNAYTGKISDKDAAAGMKIGLGRASEEKEKYQHYSQHGSSSSSSSSSSKSSSSSSSSRLPSIKK